MRTTAMGQDMRSSLKICHGFSDGGTFMALMQTLRNWLATGKSYGINSRRSRHARAMTQAILETLEPRLLLSGQQNSEDSWINRLYVYDGHNVSHYIQTDSSDIPTLNLMPN